MPKWKTTGKTYRTTLTLTKDMHDNATNRSQALGLTFHEYLRHLIAQDTNVEKTQTKEINKINKRDAEYINRALKQYDQYNRETITTKQEIAELLESTSKSNK